MSRTLIILIECACETYHLRLLVSQIDFFGFGNTNFNCVALTELFVQIFWFFVKKSYSCIEYYTKYLSPTLSSDKIRIYSRVKPFKRNYSWIINDLQLSYINFQKYFSCIEGRYLFGALSNNYLLVDETWIFSFRLTKMAMNRTGQFYSLHINL